LSFCLAAGALLCLPICRADFDEAIDSPMYKDPDLPTPPVSYILPEKTRALWVKALGRPEGDIRRQAADAVTRARRLGVKGLEATIDALQAAMDRPDQNPAARLAVAQALIALDARDTASLLFRQSQAGDGDLRDVVEPTLARWDYQPARATWLERLRAPQLGSGQQTMPQSPRDLLLAVRGLAAVKEAGAADPLREITLAPDTAPAVRLKAARALGTIRADGLESDAEGLAGDSSAQGLAGRLAAAYLLQRHRGDRAVHVLLRLADDAEPAVAALAVARLIEIDPDLIVPALDRLEASPDANLRSLAVEDLSRRPTDNHIRRLADRLADAEPDVRRNARHALETLAADRQFHDLIMTEGTRVLAGAAWQGQEEATILLARLDNKAAAKRLLELLKSDRPEVCVTAAWGLRRLAVPETLPDATTYVAAALKRARDATGPAQETLDHHLSQLNQLLGHLAASSPDHVATDKADAVLRQFIPRMEPPMRPVACPESRAAAAWALGKIHEGAPDEALAAALTGRLNDSTSQPPEDARVRCMCAVALGRMKARDMLPSLRAGFASREPSLDPVNNACGWAVEQITGEAVPPPKTIERVVNERFLVPNN
jgi:HEAT repeat protein